MNYSFAKSFTAVLAWSVLLIVETHGADAAKPKSSMKPVTPVTLNQKGDGYRGIWYKIGSTGDEFQYKYSGGLGTYCDHHHPFAVYCPEAKKTFFCFGGTPADKNDRLLHFVSYFDHETGTVPQPTLLLDKKTNDAHDNPVMIVDKQGYLWIFSTSHGLSRPSYIHRSTQPFSIEAFELIPAVHSEKKGDEPVDNFSYLQPAYDPDLGFVCFFTRYHFPVNRTNCFMSSRDGVHWSAFQRLAAIGDGHYQIGAAGHGKVATFFNVHPKGQGLDWRTNLYYMESLDGGETWQSADGKRIEPPLTDVQNAALVYDYQAKGLLMYDKDMAFDADGHPVIAYLTSAGSRPGPSDVPKTLRVARYNGKAWEDYPITTVDHNYDSLSIYIDSSDLWRAIGPTEPGPQPFGTGGEMVMWTSGDRGMTWKKERQLTANSKYNHTYARRPVNAHPEFYALWADGNARKPSDSSLYFCNQKGDVYRLPRTMTEPAVKPELVTTSQ